MSRKHSKETWDAPSAFGPCVCSQLRRTARKVSALYDHALAAAGLTVTQHALLVNIARAGEVSRSSLAARLGMDRTTLTRDLKPLEKANLVAAAESADRRERLLRLSPEGRRRLRRSYECWEKTQREFTSSIGTGTVEALRETLAAVEAAAGGLSKS
jgi:DNA-binding MarR family transcriptional regulator